MIAIVDYGMGNRRSVEKAFEHVGAPVCVSSDPQTLRRAAGLVVPGVGAFPRAMENLHRSGLDELLRERVAAGIPTLGICLGMQLAFERSTELGGAEGLGIVPGVVRELRAGKDLKLPHIGWSEVAWSERSPLLEQLPDDCAFYHVHSFACEPLRPALGVAEYGERFASAVSQGNFWGVQFHPEKSSVHGLRLLANFAALCA
ncbi:MAG: imidazole glycerol phosphate synthase subunit HisH [Solirubrobacteraceae bacterium]